MKQGIEIAMILFLIMGVSACTTFKPGCYLQDQAVSIASGVVVEQLQCWNPDAVQKDIKELVGKVGLCKETNTGPIADGLCPLVAAEVVKMIAEKAIPATWNCNAILAKEKLTTVLTNTCKKMPVSASRVTR